MVNDNFYQFVDLEELNIPNLLTLVPKENLLRRLITQSMYRERQHGPTIQINRVVKQPPKPTDPKWMGSVTWQIIQEVVKEANYYAFRLHSRCWKIRFIGESVDDCGGGYSDSIAEICEELQNMNRDDQIPVLIPSPCTADFEEKSSIEFIFRPMKEDDIDSNMSLLFEFIGLLIGAAIRQGSPLSLRRVFILMMLRI